ncbi:MAG TPA: CHAD domain-containing protein [Coleofasciculaceae cyanobacterium]|jgi:CHAD domain-containing protein
MSYKLKGKESVSTGIKRIASEQTKKAITELTCTGKLGVDEAVHQARTRLKKTRAVLRLVRYSLPPSIYEQNNQSFRDIGRNLSKLRDSKVGIKTLDNLIAHADPFSPELFSNIRRELYVDYRQEYQRVVDGDVLSLVKNELKDAQDDINNWTIKSNSWSAVDQSLNRVYARGYKDLAKVISKPTAENFHEWRKRVKYLRYQLQVINPIWKDLVQTWVEQTHVLSNYLGEDHDLAVLKEFVSSQPKRFDRDRELDFLIPLIERRQKELRTAAISLGKKIYTEKPKNFARRLGNYWQVWQEDNQKVAR